MRDFINRNFLGIIVIILLIILYLQRCTGTPEGVETTSVDTVVKYVPQPPVYIPQYIPVPETTHIITQLPPKYLPSPHIDTLTAQYEHLAKKYLEIKTYRDSIELKDSAGNKVGVVNLRDVVSENSIQSRSPDYQLTFPQTTITIRDPIKPRSQLYIGGGVLGSKSNLVIGAKSGLYLKNKKDQLYGASVNVIPNLPLIFSVEGYWKISFRKKK